MRMTVFSGNSTAIQSGIYASLRWPWFVNGSMYLYDLFPTICRAPFSSPTLANKRRSQSRTIPTSGETPHTYQPDRVNLELTLRYGIHQDSFCGIRSAGIGLNVQEQQMILSLALGWVTQSGFWAKSSHPFTIMAECRAHEPEGYHVRRRTYRKPLAAGFHGKAPAHRMRQP